MSVTVHPNPEAVRVRIKATPILGTNLIIYSAWEHQGVLVGPHSAITHFDDDEDSGYWGKVGTHQPPQWILDLPFGSVERVLECERWYTQEKLRAVALILDHEPKLASIGDIKSYGEVWIQKDDRP